MKIGIPYYTGTTTIEIESDRIKAILTPARNSGISLSEHEIVESALNCPIQSLTLEKLAENKSNILIITSDHTRPVPSRITMPLLLERIRRYNSGANIKILIATGYHRESTPDELKEKFGEEIFLSEEIIVHDAFNDSIMVSKGILPSGCELLVNNLVNWADLIVSEGFIEPHFFAGFSGGRKSILPGICSSKTITYNHNSRFIAHPNARTGVLDGNPMHKDMVFAANAVGLAFILNVTIDENKKITAAFAGHPVAAHNLGCDITRRSASVKAVKADIVVTSNGGYPLDQNIYQTVKGMSTAESCLNEGGVIIMISSCVNGHGGEGFYHWFKESASAEEITRKIMAIDPTETLPDQWEAQILARILSKCKKTIIVSKHVDPDLVSDMHMLYANSFEKALDMADHILAKKAEIVIIPDGVGIITVE